MVGLVDRPEHVTTQWFKDSGDAIILLGEWVDLADPLQGLGGSAFLQAVAGLKTGRPPRCDLEQARTLHETLRALIHGGAIKSAHDCSEGGLAVALAESCLAAQVARHTPRLIGASVQLPVLDGARHDALLFGETQNRIIITTAPLQATKVVAQARLLGVPAARIGTVGGDRLELGAGEARWSWDVKELHDLWWHALARAMQEPAT
jgi:phosphoribosylformylglycinamidine synthase